MNLNLHDYQTLTDVFCWERALAQPEVSGCSHAHWLGSGAGSNVGYRACCNNAACVWSVLHELCNIAEELGEGYIVFGDSAYPLHSFMQHILTPAAEQSLTCLQSRDITVNTLMAWFRIQVVVENLLTECVQVWGGLKDRHKLCLGSMQARSLSLTHSLTLACNHTLSCVVY